MSPSTLRPRFWISSKRSFVALLCITTAIVVCDAVMAHEFPIGHVERSASCLVHDNQLIVEYSIGLHPETMQELVAAWRAEQLKSAAKNAGRNQDDAGAELTSQNEIQPNPDPTNPDPTKPDPAKPDSIKTQSKPDSSGSKSAVNSSAADIPLKAATITKPEPKASVAGTDVAGSNDDDGLLPQQIPTTGNKDAAAPTAAKPTTTKPTATNPGDEDNDSDLPKPVDPQLLADFKLAMMQQVVTGLQVSIGDMSITEKISAAARSPRHHVDLVVTVTYDLEPSNERESESQSNSVNKTTKLIVSDKVFPNAAGGARYSLKTRGDAILNSSNVAPILLRAKRLELKPEFEANSESPTGNSQADTFTLEASLALPIK